MSNNFSEEKMQILKMISEGKVNAEEGMELLSALERDKSGVLPKKSAKWLKVRVKTMEDKTKVKVNIPISLVDIGLKLGIAYAPQLKESGLDQLDLKEIVDAVKNGAEGKIVDVEDEETQTKVEVYVE
ncbi:MAG: SHOCT-like domain-containing protein [Acetivibrionales bacterium]|jgi:hypothetical protein